MRVEMRRMERSRSIIDEEKMEMLELSGLALEVVPSPTINLALISHLNLSNNNLENIPESLTARMLNLVSLDVHSNQLRCIPNSIGCLSKLKFLNVSGNMLDSFPNTIENCRSLEELNANFNKLTKLSDTMGLELKSLKKLSVNSNKLAFLPSSLSHMITLRILDARLNCLRALPEDLENLLNLQVLNVSQNFHHLTTLPFSVGLLLSLVELDVSYNNLAVLPNSIGCLKHLQKLHVEGNPLVSPPMEIAQQKLEVVKGYLCDLINSGESEAVPTTKKKRWLGNLVRNKTFSGRLYNEARDKEAALISDSCHHRSVDGLPASRYAGSFSPRRFFSFKAPLGR